MKALKSLWLLRRVRLLVYTLAGFIMLSLTAWIALLLVLKQNHITIGEINFDFPGSLTLNEITVAQPDLNASIGEVSIDWQWGPLFSSRWSGDRFHVKDAQIMLNINDDDDPDQTPTKSDFSLALGDVRFENTHLALTTTSDSVMLKFTDFQIKGLAVGDTIVIDSVINRSSNLYWASRKAPAENSITEKTEEPFTLASVPQFAIGSLVFQQCDFLTRVEEQNHSISGFDLNVTGFKSKHVLDGTVHELNFIYQDTLSLEFNVERLLVNNRQEGTLNNMVLSFPWFALDIPQLHFSTEPTPAFSADIKAGSIRSPLIKFFTEAASNLADDAELQFAGNVDFDNNRIYTKNFTLATQGLNLVMKGFADLPGKRADSLNLSLSPVHLTTVDVASLLGVTLPADLKPVKIGSTLTATGKYSAITVGGDLLANDAKAKFSVNFQQSASALSAIQANVQINNFDIDKFYLSPPAALQIFNLELKASTRFNAAAAPSAIDLYMTADSLDIESLKVTYPDVALHYNEGVSNGTISINRQTRLVIDTLNMTNPNDLRYVGSLTTPLPHLIRENTKAGDLSTRFNGHFKTSDRGMDFKMLLDNLHFKGNSQSDEYHSTGIFHWVNGEKNMALDIRLGTGLVFSLITTPDLGPWIQRKDRWEVDYPETYLNLKLKADSSLVHQFTGYHAYLDVEHFSLKATRKTFESRLKVPVVKFEDYQINDIEASHTRKDDRKSIGITAQSIQNPYSLLSNLKINLGVQSDSVYALTLDTYLPEIKDEIDVDFLIEFLKDGYKIVPDETKPQMFGNQHWSSKGSEGIVLDNDFELLFSHLVLSNGKQNINAFTRRDSVHLSIDAFDLRPLLSLAIPDSSVTGILNLNASYNVNRDEASWNGNIDSIFYLNTALGKIITEGKHENDQLNARVALIQNNSRINIDMVKNNSPLTFKFESNGFDLSFVNTLPAAQENQLMLHGQLDGKVMGTYDNKLSANGYFTLNETRADLEKGLLVVKSDQDTIWINNDQISTHHFRFFDNHNNPIEINGHYNWTDNILDVALESGKFKVLDAEKARGNIRGTVDIASTLHFRNPKNQLEISGHLKSLPSSHVTYIYKSEITLDERSKEVEFVAFQDLKEKEAEILQFEKAAEPSDPILWDVNVDIGSTDLMIIFNEAAEEFIKMTASGNLLIKTGSDNAPLVFGNIEGQSGRLVYDLPMVSDLDFNINSVNINWNGDLTKPRFSFEGSELFRLTPNEISSTWQNNKDRVPISVLARVDDGPIDNFDIHFDLKSPNQQVATWIAALPENTREVNAISLLVFGKINTDGTSTQANALVQGMVTKMNEISRRNVKNADLSFYVDTRKANEVTNQTVNNLGYSFSKPLFNKKFRLTLGGLLDLHGSQAAQSRSNALGSIKLDYVLKNEPDITLNLTKRGTYDGVINGQVDESSFGLTFMKRFKNIFYRNKSN